MGARVIGAITGAQLENRANAEAVRPGRSGTTGRPCGMRESASQTRKEAEREPEWPFCAAWPQRPARRGSRQGQKTTSEYHWFDESAGCATVDGATPSIRPAAGF